MRTRPCSTFQPQTANGSLREKFPPRARRKQNLIHKIVWRQAVQKPWLNTGPAAIEAGNFAVAVAVRASHLGIQGISSCAVAHGAGDRCLAEAFDADLEVDALVSAFALLLCPGDEADASADADEHGADSD